MNLTQTSFSQTRARFRLLLPDANLRKRYITAFIFSITVFYFAYHALNGERGIYAYFKQSRNLEVSQAELTRLTQQRAELEKRVHLLSNASLDLDLLDEEARRTLGSAKKGEVVVLTAPR
ncbi:MAG: septum formation initiator family protein [Alphaproteobacteria bacterium]|nr:septum formation initiator family protein [Alphaproteobacteria bacterium]